jgi:phage terminase large subunit
LRIRLPANNWQPRPYQLKLWEYLENGGKRAIVAWHRRAGKDEVMMHHLSISAMTKPATYWHLLPEQAQARKAIWEAVNPHTGVRRIDECYPVELRETTRDNDMMIRFKSGSTLNVVGSDNYNSLVGSPPYGVVFSEWALANPAAWAYISPILRENGGWAAFISTPRGKNHFHSMLGMARQQNWFSEVLGARETSVFTAEGLEAERQELIGAYGADMGTALWEQEYNCSFDAAILGAYWGAELAQAEREGRIGGFAVDPHLPVHTAWDLGKGLNLAIWFFQVLAGKIAVVDYYNDINGNVETAAAAIISKGYRRGEDWVPHDAKAPDIGTGRTRVETMVRAGLKPRVLPLNDVDDGINAARITLRRCHFDAQRCGDGIEALKAYRRQWDEKLRTFVDRPLHDWASHPADAFRYLSMAWREMGGAHNDNAKPGRLIGVGPHNNVTLDDLWDLKPRKRRY